MTELEPPVLDDQWVDLDGTRVRYVIEQGPEDGPTFALVHGLGGCLADWDALLPALAARGTVVSLDLGGFGLTRVEPKRATVAGNVALLDRFVRTVVGHPVVLVGNSMGGMISALQAAAAPGTVSGVVLIDPALPFAPQALPHPLVQVAFGLYSVPPLGRRFMTSQAQRVSIDEMALQTMKLVTHDVTRVPQWLIDRHADLARRREDVPEALDAFLVAARSVFLYSLRRPTYSLQLSKVLAPVLLIHGENDRLVNVRAARAAAKAHPSWTYVEMPDMGHCPMFEDAAGTAQTILTWLDAHAKVADRARSGRAA